jgi:hypothetical protein
MTVVGKHHSAPDLGLKTTQLIDAQALITACARLTLTTTYIQLVETFTFCISKLRQEYEYITESNCRSDP